MEQQQQVLFAENKSLRLENEKLKRELETLRVELMLEKDLNNRAIQIMQLMRRINSVRDTTRE